MRWALGISVLGHVLLVALLAFGLPQLRNPKVERITANAIGMITEAELDALSQPNLPPARDARASAAAAAAEPKTQEAVRKDAATAQATAAAAAKNIAANELPAAAAAVASNAQAQLAPPSNVPDAQASAARVTPNVTSSVTPPITPSVASQPSAPAPTTTPAITTAQTAQTPPLPRRRQPPEASAIKPVELAAVRPDAVRTVQQPGLAPVIPPKSAPTTKAPEQEIARPNEATPPKPPEIAAAKPPETAPAKQPDTPEQPRPREALAQAPQARTQARRTPLPPRRPPALIDPPDDPPQRQLAKAPTKKPKTNTDFLSAMRAGIGSKPTNDGMASVADALGVGVSGTRVSASDQAALSKRLGTCWRPLTGQRNADQLVVVLVVELDSTSKVSKIRVVEEPSKSMGRPGRLAIERARQAIQSCSPFNQPGALTLPLGKYSDWRTMRIRFDPSKIAG